LDAAISHLAQAVSLEPEFAPAWFWLGRASGQSAGSGGLVERIQLAGKTRDAFALAFERNPDNFGYAYALVQFHLRAPGIVGGGSEKARDVIGRFTGRRPEGRRLLEASYSLAENDEDRTLSLLSEVDNLDDGIIRRIWKEIALHLGQS
jgi:hypothetical protein